MNAEKIQQSVAMDIYPSSVKQVGDVTYFLGLHNHEKLIGCVGQGQIDGDEHGAIGGEPVTVGPTDHENARVIRNLFPWTAPAPIGLETSIGLGDRLGLATPGHIRAVEDLPIRPILAQQSIREMNRTRRTPEDVMDAATWGVFEEGYTGGFGSDADHLQTLDDIDDTAAEGFTLFTIDPGAHVENTADELHVDHLADYYEKLDFDALEISSNDLSARYVGRHFALDGGQTIEMDEIAFLRAAVKYGQAVAHTASMYRHLAGGVDRPFELEVSVDETEAPTTPGEHYFFANELKRLGVQWVSMAPRFIGRFEKGVDYIGDLDAFAASFAEHASVMRTLGPYKISIHSGSDKFSIYPIVAELTEGRVHLKTAGTSYLEALRTLAGVQPELFAEILDFARERYEDDKATYHVSADVSKVPASADLAPQKWPELLEDFHAREVLHVTFGSVLTEDGGKRFGQRLLTALQRNEQDYYQALRTHLRRHAEPLV